MKKLVEGESIVCTVTGMTGTVAYPGSYHIANRLRVLVKWDNGDITGAFVDQLIGISDEVEVLWARDG